MIELTIKIRSSLGQDAPDDLAEQVTRIFGDWRDGRYPFWAEAIKRGLTEIIDQAARRSLEDEFYRLYGNEMVPSGPQSRTSKAVIEAEKAAEDLRVNVHEIVCSEVRPADESQQREQA